VLADYELREKPGQPKSGVFRGVARTNWYVDKNGQLRYDELYRAGDGYRNNQFVGTWTSYTTQKSLRCNWGDYRIPNSGDFDIGAGEFNPASTYYSQGWQYYAMLSNPKISEQARARALKSEQRTWWK
jgi:hypothetical protein